MFVKPQSMLSIFNEQPKVFSLFFFATTSNDLQFINSLSKLAIKLQSISCSFLYLFL